jgi:hypothetical protein
MGFPNGKWFFLNGGCNTQKSSNESFNVVPTRIHIPSEENV